MSIESRQPAGQPTGGQFAPTSGSDAGVDLADHDVLPRTTLAVLMEAAEHEDFRGQWHYLGDRSRGEWTAPDGGRFDLTLTDTGLKVSAKDAPVVSETTDSTSPSDVTDVLARAWRANKMRDLAEQESDIYGSPKAMLDQMRMDPQGRVTDTTISTEDGDVHVVFTQAGALLLTRKGASGAPQEVSRGEEWLLSGELNLDTRPNSTEPPLREALSQSAQRISTWGANAVAAFRA